MGIYLDCFAFEVPNASPLLELIIEPAFAVRSVCFQVHKSSGNAYKAFWNYEITSREMPKLIHQYIKNRPDVKNWTQVRLLDDPEFAKYIRKNTPINCIDLSAPNMIIVDDVINADFGASRFVAAGGLDGHSYTLKIYEKEYKGYKARNGVTDGETLTEMCAAFVNVCRTRGFKCGVYATSTGWRTASTRPLSPARQSGAPSGRGTATGRGRQSGRTSTNWKSGDVSLTGIFFSMGVRYECGTLLRGSENFSLLRCVFPLRPCSWSVVRHRRRSGRT